MLLLISFLLPYLDPEIIYIPVLSSPGLIVFYGALGFLLIYWVIKFIASVLTGG